MAALSFPLKLKSTGGGLARGYSVIRQNLGAAAGMLVVLAASFTTLALHPIAGVIVNAVVLAALVALALWREPVRKLAISVAILPVATMLSLSLPPASPFAQSVVLYDSLLLLALAYRYLFALEEPVNVTKLTLRGYALALPLMVVLGQLLGLIAYGLLRNHYAFGNISTGLVALCVIVFAFAEEMFFRGLVQQQAAKVMHPAIAAILSACLYAVVTINHTTILTPLFALLAGAVLAATYYKKQNLILTTTINAATKLTFLGLLATFSLR